jgi:malate dehydrogenase (oxaloacetate-decarboxylating)(NADP+)
VSTVRNLFNQAVVEAMARHNSLPIIFPLCNPTEKMECLADEAYQWTKGTVVFAGGVQLPNVHLNGHTYIPRRPTTSTSSRRWAWPSWPPTPRW